MQFSSAKVNKISGGTFQARKIKKTTPKKFLIFLEIELSSTKLKKLL